MERFFGVLVEHYGGAFPLWLSPVQVRVATIGDEQNDYGEEIFKILKDGKIRVEKDFRNEKLGFKVREAQVEKVPYLLVIGNKEVEQGTVSPRKLGGKNMASMRIEEFIDSLHSELDPEKWREVEKL